MDNFILEHINKLHREYLSDEGIKSLNVLECELGILTAEFDLVNEQLERNRYVTISQAAKIMNINRKRLDEIIRNSEIPVIKYTSKTLLIDLVDIRNFVQSKKIYYPKKEVNE